MHRKVDANVLREGSKKFVFDHGCKATPSHCHFHG